MSFWLRVGETVGYGIAAMLLGPKVAIEQRRRRTARRAFATWLGDEVYTKQIAEPGRVRRLVERRDAELAFLLECELRPVEDRATITIRVDPLPGVREDHVLVERDAPDSPDGWTELATEAVTGAAELCRRHRGDGYR